MKSSTARSALSIHPANGADHLQDEHHDHPLLGPQSVLLPASSIRLLPASLRMYTEEEVSNMLQVSLSLLRKWRFERTKGRKEGPPFRKLGRLVRYPEPGLVDYINGR